MAVGSSNDFDLVVLGAGTGGYTAAFRAAQLGLRSPSSTRTRSAGPASTAAASRPRRCSNRPAFAERIRHAKDYGLVARRASRRVDYAADGRPPRPGREADVDRASRRSSTRTRSTWVPGRGRLEGPSKVRVSQPGEDGTPGGGGERVLQATDVILATGSRVK